MLSHSTAPLAIQNWTAICVVDVANTDTDTKWMKTATEKKYLYEFKCVIMVEFSAFQVVLGELLGLFNICKCCIYEKRRWRGKSPTVAYTTTNSEQWANDHEWSSWAVEQRLNITSIDHCMCFVVLDHRWATTAGNQPTTTTNYCIGIQVLLVLCSKILHHHAVVVALHHHTFDFVYLFLFCLFRTFFVFCFVWYS